MNRSWKPGAATGAAARAAAQARHALGDDGFAQAWEHLTHIFTKLGITTRAELAVQAAARDLTARRSDR